ncbi:MULTISPECIES: class I SAM-dependent DNA methyltransferase [unclassified Endozoicomonas]|uniref:class I SAM-dependent DNA methyltransferase n=1 Tax=unclassified Endozoicomonas TaxID=2644528 RepID=UPI003BB0227D
MGTDFFAQKASSYELTKTRVANVENIANSILRNVKLDETMHLMDFGSGTGLLLERIAPHVKKITAIDISPSMNQQLEQKRNKIHCQLDILEIDLERRDMDHQYNGVISSMTMHHVKNIEKMFRKLHSMLESEGFIAIADLDKEDGSFHTEDTGVHHHGFDRKAITKAAVDAGFIKVKVTSASVVHKPHGNYPVFLLTATKSSST